MVLKGDHRLQVEKKELGRQSRTKLEIRFDAHMLGTMDDYAESRTFSICAYIGNIKFSFESPLRRAVQVL